MKEHLLLAYQLMLRNFIELRTTSLGYDVTHNRLDSFTSITIYLEPYKHSHKPIWAGQSNNWDTFSQVTLEVIDVGVISY